MGMQKSISVCLVEMMQFAYEIINGTHERTVEEKQEKKKNKKTMMIMMRVEEKRTQI
jgi:hypothetical protein